MLTSKERKALSSIGQTLNPVFQIGKNGVTEVLIRELGDVLDARELIKIGVLRGCDYTAKEIISELCASLGADPVSCVGNKMVIYRRSNRRDIKHVEF